MPVSNLGWNLRDSTPVFEAFHRKRKFSNEFTSNFQTDDDVKRKCTRWNVDENHDNWPLAADHTMMPLQDSLQNNNHAFLNSSALHSPDRTQHDVSFQLYSKPMQPISSLCQNTESLNATSCFQQQAKESHQIISREDHIMDLCDETYPTTVMEQTNNMESNKMESESNSSSKPFQAEFCGTLSCVGGNKSPGSGNVRCFCRPFWDGIGEMVPYISDYY